MGPTQLETGGANTPVRAVVVAKRPEYGLHVRFISTNSVCSISVSIYHSYVDTLQYLSHSKCICGWFIILCHIDLHIYIPYSYMVHIDRYRYLFHSISIYIIFNRQIPRTQALEFWCSPAKVLLGVLISWVLRIGTFVGKMIEHDDTPLKTILSHGFCIYPIFRSAVWDMWCSLNRVVQKLHLISFRKSLLTVGI